MKKVLVLVFILSMVFSLCSCSGPQSKGYLVIVGSSRPKKIMKRFVELTEKQGGGKIVVFPMASGAPAETGLYEIEKLTAAGITLWDTDVIRVLEEVLPSQFGGGPTSYQLVEDEIDAQPRVTLRVDPAIGPVNADEVGEAFLKGIHAAGKRLWKTPGFFRVERQAPMTAGSGKILHLHLERSSSP